MQKFDTPAPISAVLDIPAGRIQFIAADRADTTVEVRPADASKGRDVKAAEQITVDYGDGVLRIAAAAAKNRLLGSSGSVEVTVQLPAGSRVEAKAAAADLRGVGRLGDVTFEGAQGTVKLDEAAERPPHPPGRRRLGRPPDRLRGDQHPEGRHPHRRGRPRHGRAAHRSRRDLGRRRPRRLRLAGRRHHATAGSTTRSEHRRRRRRPEHPRDHRLRRHHRPQPLTRRSPPAASPRREQPP